MSAPFIFYQNDIKDPLRVSVEYLQYFRLSVIVILKSLLYIFGNSEYPQFLNYRPY